MVINKSKIIIRPEKPSEYEKVNKLIFDAFTEQHNIEIVPMVAALFYAGILITIVSYQKMIGLQEEKEKYFVEQQQVHAIQERMEEVEQFYHGIRQMKHEKKNHLTNIRIISEI